MSSLRHDGCRNWVVAPNPDTKHKAPTENPGHLEFGSGYTIWKSYAHHETDDSDDEFVAVDEAPTKYISKVSERELPDDVSDVGRGVDEATKERWVMRRFTLQSSPVPEYLISQTKVMNMSLGMR